MAGDPGKKNHAGGILIEEVIILIFFYIGLLFIDGHQIAVKVEPIEQSAKDAANVNADNPMLPLATIVRASDPNALHCLGVTIVGNVRKPLIE